MKLVNYRDKYNEMHGQQNVKITKLIVVFRNFTNASPNSLTSGCCQLLILHTVGAMNEYGTPVE